MKKIVSFIPFYNLDKSFWCKDLGQIGYTFMNEKGFKSEVWTLRKKGQKDFLIRGQNRIGYRNLFSIYFSLFISAKNIDILHIMHVNIYSLVSCIIYKMRNHNGTIYLKMDSPLIEEDRDKRIKIKKIPGIIRGILFKNVDYFGFEDKKLQDFYISEFPEFKNHFIFTTNGFLSEPNIIGDLPKQNRIVLVGRFGSYQKNNEMLLNMFQEYNCDFLNNWDFYLCGGMTKEFKEKLKNCRVKNQVNMHFHEMGFLSHNELYGLLKTCKIFLHTARFEGDPLIQYDAMYSGCFMVSTDVANIKQNYIKNYSLFYESNNVEQLKSTLEKAINKVTTLENTDFLNIQNYGLNNFQWKDALNEILNKF